MKVFAIRDEEMRPLKDLAYLFYYEKKKQFYAEIPEDSDPWELPMIMFDFAMKGIYTLSSEWSRTWVEQRIVPTDRQNLGQILRDNGLTEYDEYKLLLSCHGRCSQDSCYIVPVSEKELPDEILKRKLYKVETAFPLEQEHMLVFFRDGSSRLCDIKKAAADSRQLRRLLSYRDALSRFEILTGGYGIRWESGLSVDDRTLYRSGTALPLSPDYFRSSLGKILVDTKGACEMLGCSRQYVSSLVKEGRLKPVRQLEKSTIFLRSDLQDIG